MDDIGTEKPVCFSSKTFDRHQENYTVTEKECLAVVWATEQHKTQLQGAPFTIETDHEALRYLIQSKDAVGRLARWAMKLQQFDMVVKYRKGEENGAADHVSRIKQLPNGTYEVGQIQDPFPTIAMTRQRSQAEVRWIKENEQHKELTWERLLTEQANDPWIQAIQAYKLLGIEPEDKKFSNWLKANSSSLILDDGIWLQLLDVYVPKGTPTRKAAVVLVPESLREEVLHKLHNHPFYGHKGMLATYDQLKSAYYWDTMYTDCRRYVRECDTCQAKSKPSNDIPHRHRPIPEIPFRTVSMDHAGPFDFKKGSIKRRRIKWRRQPIEAEDQQNLDTALS